MSLQSHLVQCSIKLKLKTQGRSKVHLSLLKETHICDVWQNNFVEQINIISELIDEYNVIAMDTEFPGINQFNIKNDNGDDDKEVEYQQVRENVKASKIIQIGLSIANEEGFVPLPCNTWQFNFKFEEDRDIIKPDVLMLLKKAGINFDELRQRGINLSEFCDYATSSGLILNEDLKWIVFHGGFDFAYLVQMFHHSGVPNTSDEFTKLMKLYFPQTYDLKFSLKENLQLRDVGLSKLAYKINVERIGPEHQAGSDSLLTLACYFQLKQQPTFKNEANQIEKQVNVIYGIGKGYVNNSRWKLYDTSAAINQEANQYEAFDNTFSMYNQNYQYDYQFYNQDSQFQVNNNNYQKQQYNNPQQQQQQQNYFYNMQQQNFSEQEGNNKKKMNY